MRSESSAIRATITWLFGPAVWAAHFFLLYGIAGFACTPSDAARQENIRYLSLALTAIALSALIGFLVRQALAVRGQECPHITERIPAFLASTANALVVLAIIGIVWTAAGATMIPACGSGTE